MPEIIMHFPKKQEDVYILQKKIAQVHAEAVVKYLEKLPFPKEQKVALLAALKRGCNRNKNINTCEKHKTEL